MKQVGYVSAVMAWICVALVTGPAVSKAIREVKGVKAEVSQDEMQALRLLEKAKDLHKAGQSEQSMKLLETIIDQWPASQVRFRVWLTLGKQAMDRAMWNEAGKAFRQAQGIHKEGQALDGEDLEIYLEAMYLSGVAFYESGQYAQAFPVLRQITMRYPDSTWANQAYYYIGMCHFAKENWSRAIQNLSRVGTLIDPQSPAAEFMEAGRRFFVKVTDGDLPVLYRMGKETAVEVTTKRGDKETIKCVPLSSAANEFVGSISSEIGLPKPGDGRLQVWGDDEITTLYYDENTKEGEYKVPRKAVTKAVSSGTVSFTVATFDRRADLAYQDENVYVTVFDSDLDTGPEAQTVSVRVMARYKKAADDTEKAKPQEAGVDIDKILKEEKESKYAVRDEVTLTLTEVMPDGSKPPVGQPVHTGYFVGSAAIQAAAADEQGNLTDNVLSANLDDEIVAAYVDNRYLGGTDPREMTVAIKVVGKLTKIPVAKQPYVSDAQKRAQKNIVEATAFMELGKIFRDMGLMKGAAEKCDSGLELADGVIGEQVEIPRKMREDAFRLKWELALTKNDLDGALATCQVFAKLFPESEFVDQALLRIGTVNEERKNYEEAVRIYNQIMALPVSSSKAEAVFRIAQIQEKETMAKFDAAAMTARSGGAPVSEEAKETAALAAAVPFYKRCVEQFPESRFAGDSLAKMVDYYVLTKDYGAAEDILEQVTLDYPDADFIPRMLLKWVLVSARRGNLVKAKEKCQELLFEHPQTQYAKKASQLLEAIEKQSGGGDAGAKARSESKKKGGDEDAQ